MSKLFEAKGAATKEEVAEARRVLQSGDDKEKRSKMAAMAQWLKANEPNGAGINSRGDDRKKYLEAYLVFQLRQKKAKKTTTVTGSNSHQEKEMSAWYMWGKEKMHLELGQKKADSWIASGKLKHFPDMVTKLDGEWDREYRCPQSWQQVVDEESTTRDIAATLDGHEDEVGLMGGTTITGVVKVEPTKKSAAEILEEKKSELRANPTAHVRKFQDYLMEAKVLATKIEGKRYIGELEADNNKHVKKIAVVIKILESLCVSKKETQAEALSKLIESMVALEVEHKEIDEWAVRFGVIQENKKRKKSKK
jgi:hypothetical protein